MDVTFWNVTITVSDKTPQEAYNALCEVFEDANKEGCNFGFETDSFTTEDKPDEYRDTSELWGE